jgi:glycosyltransferase involved in cell wall biosynthesis
MMNVLFITEDLSPPFDEGIKKSANYFFQELSRNYNTQGICILGNEIHTEGTRLFQVTANRLFLSRRIRSLIRIFRPRVIVYLPSSSATFPSFLRLRVLKYFQPEAKCIMLSMQPKPLAGYKKRIIRKLGTEIVLTPSPEVKEMMESLSIKCRLIPLFTDLASFTPNMDKERKLFLRTKYNLPQDKYIITHVGHLNWGRNLESLVPLQTGDNQVVIVGSSSTPADAPKEVPLKEKLERAGILILDGFIPDIQEIYQLSDLYVFPVAFTAGSIGLPLSILEARACGIPVLTTEYGSVKTFLGDDKRGIRYSKLENFPEHSEQILRERTDYSTTGVRSLNEQLRRMLEETVSN